MSSFEQYFGSAALELSLPDTSIPFPPSSTADAWLSKLRDPQRERRLAFFDEQMHYFLTVQLNHPASLPPADPDNPPISLLKFLTHLQISTEAMFISSLPAARPDKEGSILLSAPPRSSSSLKLNPRSATLQVHHPSIFPPSTPNPTPVTAQNDRQYLNVDGVLLSAGIWGQDESEAFSLLWSTTSKTWIAVYRLTLTVSYTRLTFPNPLLCLTIATTLREKPLALGQQKSPLRTFLMSFPEVTSNHSTPITADGLASAQGQQSESEAFEEVNLLEGLAAGPTFPPSSTYLPSSRLGSESRQKLFALPPIVQPPSSTPTPSPLTATRMAPPTLRKSFRKTLNVISGIQMRMRTTFVPAVMLPERASNHSEERDLRESGTDERTVVLCIEVENPIQADGMDFVVEDVEIQVGDEGAKATLIGWGDSLVDSKIFPLLISPQGQYNLLYAVTFLQSPEENDALLATGGRKHDPQDLRRTVNINIIGRPSPKMSGQAIYPTEIFTSKWNTVLNLSPHEVLPEPPSPFPVTALSNVAPPLASATQKRHTLPGTIPGSPLRPSSPIPAVPRLSVPNPGSSLKTPYHPLPPSLQMPRSPTTFEAPQLSSQLSFYEKKDSLPEPPPTPAYPAYPSSPAWPMTPPSQMPETSQSQMYVGPSVEMRRDKGPMVTNSAPATPLPNHHIYGEEEPRVDEPVVVSIGLLEDQDDSDFRLSVHDNFTLDIFVFNRSGRTRRFEMSCPDRRNQRRKGDGGKSTGALGVLPLDNRVRIGPLLPAACQSVRMRFMALMAGVHTIDTLTLTDIESGNSTNLRSVMDIVVHE
ncbi:hypothetical protein BDZ89DRAFT_1057018, partial [Hymenopellis radicata]